MSSTTPKKGGKESSNTIEMRTADVDDQSSSSDYASPVLKATGGGNGGDNGHNGHSKGSLNKKRSREELFAKETEMVLTANALTGNGDNEKFSRLRWTEEMERILTECVHPHIRTTPGKGLKQVDWNAVLDEMNTRFPHFEFTRKSLKNKYQRLGGLALENGGAAVSSDLSNGLNTSSSYLANTSADEGDYEDANDLVKLKSASKDAKALTFFDKSAISVSAILAEDREALLSEKAIDEFTNHENYSKIREDPNQALLIIEKLMIYENAKKFFLVKPDSLRVLFIQKWINQPTSPTPAVATTSTSTPQQGNKIK